MKAYPSLPRPLHQPSGPPAALLFAATLLWTSNIDASTQKGPVVQSRPNIIFLLSDDQRADSLGCYGNNTIKTPHIDRLAREGVRFENAFVTSAICTPSRACFFLGQYERRHGVNFNSGTAMAPEAWKNSYPVRLRASGYFTGYVGKNHVPIGTSGYKSGLVEESFDFWYAGQHQLTFYPKRVHPIFKDAKADTQVEIIEEGALSFLDSKTPYISGARVFMGKRRERQPFCLTIALNLPHNQGTSTMEMRPEDPELYRVAYRDPSVQIELPETYIAKDAIESPKIPPDVLYSEFRQSSYDYVNSPETLRERIIREYQTITGIDRLVRNLRQMLEEEGVANNTVIIYASDHGLMHGEFGIGGKALNYDPCLRIPLIIYDPRLPQELRDKPRPELVLSIDIAPTILNFAGVEIPDTVQGESLLPLLEGKSKAWRNYAFSENLWSTAYGNPRCETVQDLNWKYTRYFANDRKLAAAVKADPAAQAAAYRRWLTSSIKGEKPSYEELFDLANDPDEKINLADNPSALPVLNKMRMELDHQVRAAKGDVDADPLTVPVRQPKAKP